MYRKTERRWREEFVSRRPPPITRNRTPIDLHCYSLRGRRGTITYSKPRCRRILASCQNSPPCPAPCVLPKAAAPHMPTSPHIPTLHPLHNPSKPCPLLLFLTATVDDFWFPSPSSLTIPPIVPTTPLYAPTSTTVTTRFSFLITQST